MSINRNRITYIVLFLLTIIIGLLSRYFSAYLPDSINLYLGDALWALMVYFLAGIIFKHITILKLGVITLLFCYAIEVSQLYQASWINAVRNTHLGALVLGRGFLWSDLLAYLCGVGTGMIIEKITFKANKNV